jgi:hypothetical protein
LKNTREKLDILNAYRELGSYRAAALPCQTTDKTVKRVVQRLEAGGPYQRRPRQLVANTACVRELIEERVRATDGMITAKRLLLVARAAGYRCSARNPRRAAGRGQGEVAAAAPAVPALGAGAGPAPGSPLDAGQGRSADVLRGAGLVAVPLRAICPGPAPGDHAEAAGGVPGGVGRGAGSGAHRPDGVPTCGGGGQPGGAAPRVRPLRRPLRVPARLLRGGRPRVEGVVVHLAGYGQRDLVVPEEGFGGDGSEPTGQRGFGAWR